jgi:hypothetical protein
MLPVRLTYSAATQAGALATQHTCHHATLPAAVRSADWPITSKVSPVFATPTTRAEVLGLARRLSGSASIRAIGAVSSSKGSAVGVGIVLGMGVDVNVGTGVGGTALG